MSDSLRKALETREQEIRRGLTEAKAERERLMARVRELDKLIERARISLGEKPGQSDQATAPDAERSLPPRTLHEALAKVLAERNNNPLTARELANEINSRRLYRKKDGSPVEANQIHARVNNYLDSWFTKTGGGICLIPDRVEWLLERGE